MPSNQTSNTDIREQIAYLLDRTANFPNHNLRDGSIDKIVELIESSQAAAVQAARVDEHTQIMEMKPLTTVDSLINLWRDRMNERLAQLQAKGGQE